MIRYRAAWVLPVAGPPIRDGQVAVADGRIVAVASARGRDAGTVDLGDVAILPGLVNAHTHLELSYLRDEVPPASQFVSWIGSVVQARRKRPDPSSQEILDGVHAGIAEAVQCGTALVGDISNTLVTFEPIARSQLAGVLFYELLKFNADDPDALVEDACRRIDALENAGSVRATLAAHAPYSVSPRLFRSIRAALDRRVVRPCSVHLAESRDEVEFIRTGGGAWRQFLESVGAWDPGWQPPGVSPVHYLDEAGFLDERTLAIHGVQMGPDDLRRLARRGTTIVACPRSNARTGAGDPPVAAFYEAGVRVAIGTDSLASTPDLNVFAELAAMRRLAPDVSAASLIDSATRQGARALGFDDEYGTLQAGRRARMIAVGVPSGVADVEEYLVSGIAPSAVSWVGSGTSAAAPAS